MPGVPSVFNHHFALLPATASGGSGAKGHNVFLQNSRQKQVIHLNHTLLDWCHPSPLRSSVMTEHAAQVYTTTMSKKMKQLHKKFFFLFLGGWRKWFKRNNLIKVLGKNERAVEYKIHCMLWGRCKCVIVWVKKNYLKIQGYQGQLATHNKRDKRQCCRSKRSSLYKKMNSIDLREAEIKKEGQLTGIVKRRPSWEIEILVKVLHEVFFKVF